MTCIPPYSHSVSVLYIIPPDEKPTMPLLLSFPGNINIAQQIGATSTVFGTLLLNDDNQERVTALAKQFGNEASEVNMAILREWLRGSGVKPVTWGKLVEVLKKCKLDELAEKIESHFKCKLHTPGTRRINFRPLWVPVVFLCYNLLVR